MIMHIAQRRLAPPTRRLHVVTSARLKAGEKVCARRQNKGSSGSKKTCPTTIHMSCQRTIQYLPKHTFTLENINRCTFIYKREALHCAAANMLSTLPPTFLKKKIYRPRNKVLTHELVNIINDLLSEHRMTKEEKESHRRCGALEVKDSSTKCSARVRQNRTFVLKYVREYSI